MVILIISSNLAIAESPSNIHKTEVDHRKMDHSKMEMNKTNRKNSIKPRKELAFGSKNSVMKTLLANEKLHEAFFSYSGKAVQKAATDLKIAIENIQDKEVLKLLKFSKGKLLEIKESNDRQENNENYHLVSMALIYIVKTYDLGSDYNSYYCPMLKKSWVQNSSKKEKVHNPYAPDMPHCGYQDTQL